MVRGLLEGGQHEDAVLHFRDAEPGDSEDLPLRRELKRRSRSYPIWVDHKNQGGGRSHSINGGSHLWERLFFS